MSAACLLLRARQKPPLHASNHKRHVCAACAGSRCRRATSTPMQCVCWVSHSTSYAQHIIKTGQNRGTKPAHATVHRWVQAHQTCTLHSTGRQRNMCHVPQQLAARHQCHTACVQNRCRPLLPAEGWRAATTAACSRYPNMAQHEQKASGNKRRQCWETRQRASSMVIILRASPNVLLHGDAGLLTPAAWKQGAPRVVQQRRSARH